MSASKKVIIYGATGAVGTGLIEIISKKNPSWTILAASRSGGAKSYLDSLQLSNVMLIKADAENYEDMKKRTEDVDMVFSCIGFPQYEAKYWAKHWPVVVDNLLSCTSSQRPLIFCDNLYAYGAGRKISTSTKPITANLKTKLGVRASIRNRFEDRMNESSSSIVVIGGADFFGPRLADKTFLGDCFIGKMVDGQRPLAFVTADAVHDFCFAPDFSKALYIAAMNPSKAYGKFWICPHSVKNKTLKQLALIVNDNLEKPLLSESVTLLPKAAVRVLGWFMPLMKEMREMLPFWSYDYTINDEDFRKTFQMDSTPAEVALQKTIVWYQDLSVSSSSYECK